MHDMEKFLSLFFAGCMDDSFDILSARNLMLLSFEFCCALLRQRKDRFFFLLHCCSCVCEFGVVATHHIYCKIAKHFDFKGLHLID